MTKIVPIPADLQATHEIFWEDLFDVAVPNGLPDSGYWDYRTQHVNDEDASLVDATDNNGHVSVGPRDYKGTTENVLILKAIKESQAFTSHNESADGKQFWWRTGAIHTRGPHDQDSDYLAPDPNNPRQGFGYGVYEADFKLPQGNCAGTWVALWMLGRVNSEHPKFSNGENGWAFAGEQDWLEWLGKEIYRIHCTLHRSEIQNSWPKPPGGNPKALGFYKDLAISWQQDWHTIRYVWEKNAIRWFIDGVQVKKIKLELDGTVGVYDVDGLRRDDPRFDTIGEFGWPWDLEHNNNWHLILNLAMGGNWGGPIEPTLTEAEFLIRRVSQYVPKGSGTPAPYKPPTVASKSVTQKFPYANGSAHPPVLEGSPSFLFEGYDDAHQNMNILSGRLRSVITPVASAGADTPSGESDGRLGLDMYSYVAASLETEQDEIYLAFDIQFEDWMFANNGTGNYNSDGILFGFGNASMNGGHSYVAPNGYSTGYRVRLAWAPNPPAGHVRLGWLVYHIDQIEGNGDFYYIADLPINEYHRIECRMKLNSPERSVGAHDAPADGELQCVVNGVMRYDNAHTGHNLRWRHTAGLQVDRYFIEYYHLGGDGVDDDLAIDVDNITYASGNEIPDWSNLGAPPAEPEPAAIPPYIEDFTGYPNGSTDWERRVPDGALPNRVAWAAGNEYNKPANSEYVQNGALWSHVEPGTHEGTDRKFSFKYCYGEEPLAAYAKYTLKLPEGMTHGKDFAAGGKLPGMANHEDNGGHGGTNTNGTNGWTMRPGWHNYPGQGPFPANTIRLGTYNYHLDRIKKYGEVIIFNKQYPDGNFPTGRDYVIEQWLVMNTQVSSTGNKDVDFPRNGRYVVAINGVIELDMPVRLSHVRMGVPNFWHNFYAGASGGLHAAPAGSDFRVGFDGYDFRGGDSLAQLPSLPGGAVPVVVPPPVVTSINPRLVPLSHNSMKLVVTPLAPSGKIHVALSTTKNVVSDVAQAKVNLAAGLDIAGNAPVWSKTLTAETTNDIEVVFGGLAPSTRYYPEAFGGELPTSPAPTPPLPTSRMRLKTTAPRLCTYGVSGHRRLADPAFRDAQAKFDLIVLSLWRGYRLDSTGEGAHDIINDIRARCDAAGNTEALIGKYTNGMQTAPHTVASTDAEYDRVTKMLAEDWYMKRANGSYVEHWPGRDMVDLTRWAPRDAAGLTSAQWFADRNYELFFHNKNLDFVFGDDMHSAVRRTVDVNRDGKDESAVNTNMDKLEIPAAYHEVSAANRQGHRDYVDRMRELRPDIGFIGNNPGSIQDNFGNMGDAEYAGAFDGLYEGFSGFSWSLPEWSATGWVDSCKIYQNYFKPGRLQNGILCVICCGNKTDYARFRYSYASVMIMGDGYFDYTAVPSWDPQKNNPALHAGSTPAGEGHYYSAWWYDEYEQHLGVAVDQPPTPGTPNFGNGLYKREYDHGLVIVNPPFNGTKTFTIPSGFKRFQGSQDAIHNNGDAAGSSVSLGQRDGIVLVKA